jgi:hypothetical protein
MSEKPSFDVGDPAYQNRFVIRINRPDFCLRSAAIKDEYHGQSG